MTTKTKALGEKVRVLRNKRGLSVRGLARLAGVDATWVSRLENGRYGRPDPRLVRLLAEALEIETSELFMAAGFEDAQTLPQLGPYLRAKYDLPDDAITQLEAHFQLFNERFDREDGRG
jgi:transcriptional regulator with XRE-family HTH domain